MDLCGQTENGAVPPDAISVRVAESHEGMQPPSAVASPVEDSAPEGWIALREGKSSVSPPVFYCDDEKIPYPRLKDVGGLDEAVPKVQLKLPYLDLFNTLMTGQNVLQSISLAILVQTLEEADRALPAYALILALISSELLFMPGVLQKIEKTSKVAFFNGCLRHGIVLDFANLSGNKNLGTLLGVLLALSGTIVVYCGASRAGVAAWVAAIQVVVTLGLNFYKFGDPWRECDTVEKSVITLPQLMEKDPTLARELLSKCKVQSESVTMARLSDILNIQRTARVEAVKDYVKRHHIEFDGAEAKTFSVDGLLLHTKKKKFQPGNDGGHPVVSWLRKKKHNGDIKAAQEDVVAFYKEIYDAGAQFAFSWNQLCTSLPEGVDYVLPFGIPHPLMNGSMAKLIKDANMRQTGKDVNNITEGKVPSTTSTTLSKRGSRLRRLRKRGAVFLIREVDRRIARHTFPRRHIREILLRN